MLITGGSGDYRGRGGSNILQAPSCTTRRRTRFESVADPLVGRNYHSGALLLPDGRVMIFGSDSLFGDKANTKPGVFEQRIEIYTPPYLYRGLAAEADRGGAAGRIARGATGDVHDRARRRRSRRCG